MNRTATGPRWAVEGNPRFLDGCGFGIRYPVAVVTVNGHALPEERLAALSGALRKALPLSGPAERAASDRENDSFRASVGWIVDTVRGLTAAAELPVFESGRVLACEQGRSTVCLPATRETMKPVIDLLHALLGLMNVFPQDADSRKLLKRLVLIVAHLGKAAPGRANVRFFVQAALETGVPFLELPSNIYLFGQGIRGRWMLSSFSEETALIAAKLAREKLLGAAIMRRAGIPVPEHQRAESVGQAEKIAERLGYPVVVKPSNQDGGRGVAAGLRNRAEVSKAFSDARKFSASVLVEKHVEGRDYRVTVFQGEVVSAVERVPGGVTGDGRSTVKELLDRLNADPLRGTGHLAQLKRLLLDDEAMTLLRQAGLEPGSVPAEGTFVRLRRVANLTTGGRPVRVLDRVHPDNRALALRAASIMRLDIAGVDLLMPDIGRSWRETGAVVCEVNAQPSLGGRTAGGTLYEPILRALVPGNGRVPVVAVLGETPSRTFVGDIETALLEEGLTPGCRDTSGVRVGGEPVADGDVEPFAAGEMLVLDRKVEAIVLCVDDDSLLYTGLPFARIDLLVLAGTALALSPRSVGAASGDSMREALELVLPACDGRIVPIEGAEPPGERYRELTAAAWDKPVSLSGALEAVVAAVPEILSRTEDSGG